MSVQRLGEKSFLVDEAAKVGYCSVCNRYLFLDKFDLVDNARFYDGKYDPLMVRWTAYCEKCGHQIECCLPYSEGMKWGVDDD